MEKKYWKEIFGLKDPGFRLSVLAGYGIDITNGVWNDGLDVYYSITAQFTGNRGFRGIALFSFQRIGFRNIGLCRGTHGSKVNAPNLKSKIKLVRSKRKFGNKSKLAIRHWRKDFALNPYYLGQELYILNKYLNFKI